MFQCVELGLGCIVGAIDKANAAAYLLREPNGVTPEEPAVLLQMRQYDVNGVAPALIPR